MDGHGRALRAREAILDKNMRFILFCLLYFVLGLAPYQLCKH